MNIVFIVVCKFPYGDASSIRALNLCKIFKEQGHSIHVISDFPSSEKAEISNICTSEHCVEKMPPVWKRSVVAKTSINKLTNYLEHNHVDVLIMNAKQDRFCAIVDICHSKGVKVIVENCEWYHFSNYKLKLLDIRYWRNQKMLKKHFAKADGFISISRLLDEHNKSLNKASVRVPTIMDVQEFECNSRIKNDKITIIYAGNPGKSKEFLLPVFQAFSKRLDYRKKMEFHIYGPDENVVKYNLGKYSSIINEVNDCIFIHGRVPQLQMPEIMKNADYLLFLRPNRLSSNAGFPTKFGESMAVGTPVISNDTGDIGLYLKNKENGFLLTDYSVESVCDAFDKLLELSENEYVTIRKNARNTAETYFDYRAYLKEIDTLFDCVMNKSN